MTVTNTLDDAEQLHENGYTPITAAEVQVGDRCGHKPYNGELTYWIASRIIRESRTVEPMMFSELGPRTPRTFHETTVWCEYPSGACLVATFDDRTVIYIAMTVEITDATEGEVG